MLPLRVLPLSGELDGVMPGAVVSDGSGPSLLLVGFGLEPPQERRSPGLDDKGGMMPLPVPRQPRDGRATLSTP